MITTGSLARDVLFGGLGFQMACKNSERLSGYWRLAGRTQPGATCNTPLDMDNYFTYKFHGGAEGWGQTLQASYLKWLQTLDTDSDGEVTFGEMRMLSNETTWKKSIQSFCNSAFRDESHKVPLKRYIELTDEWLDWCGTTRNATAITHDETYYHPIMCEAANGIRGGKNETTLVESYYKRWLQHCKGVGC